MKALSLSTLQEQFPDLILDCIGNNTDVSGFASCESYQPGDLVFCEDKSFIESLVEPEPTAIVTTPELAEKIHNDRIGILITKDVKLAQAFIRQRYDDVDLHDGEWPGIHQTAVIHDSVSVPDSVEHRPGRGHRPERQIR